MRERRVAPASLEADVLEDGDGYTVIFDAPGVGREQVQVRYTGGTVEARIERARKAYEGFDLVVAGRNIAFDGRAELPADAVVTPEASEAVIRENGTLEIRLQKHATEEDETPTAQVAD